MEENFTFVVSGVARDMGDAGRVAEELLRELKNMVWREVWRDEIELPGVELDVREAEGGGYLVIARLDFGSIRGSGE